MILSKSLNQILEDVPEAAGIFEHLEESLNNPKNRTISKVLEDFIDNNSSTKSQSGTSYNFYPSLNKDGDCKEVCVGVATKSFGSKWDEDRLRTGFKGLMKEMIQYWENCGSINKTTILLTTEWRDVDFNNDWKDIVDNHVNRGKKVIIIQVIQSGKIRTYPVV
jgi:hypothetical protein